MAFEPTLQPQRRTERFQFGIGSLLACMLGVIIAVALTRQFWTNPIVPGWLKLFLAALGGGMIGYITMRLPFLLRHLRGVSSRWKAIRKHRQELAEWTRQQRETQKQPLGPDASEPRIME